MANWAADGFSCRSAAQIGSVGPPAPIRLLRPTGRGDPEVVEARFAGLASSIVCERLAQGSGSPSVKAVTDFVPSNAVER